uniref:Uncharacterized protein n=1 Tax=Anguilla anguilla TaxID=7936 RepID=A0A0E9RS97_ANGAN
MLRDHTVYFRYETFLDTVAWASKAHTNCRNLKISSVMDLKKDVKRLLTDESDQYRLKKKQEHASAK